jgi:hypothetical protein
MAGDQTIAPRNAPKTPTADVLNRDAAGLMFYSLEEKRRVQIIYQETCNDDRIGSWIWELGYEDLIMALQLDPKLFGQLYSELSIAPQDRLEALSAVVEHYSRCIRCQLVAENHRWAEGVVEEVFSLARKMPKGKAARHA